MFTCKSYKPLNSVLAYFILFGISLSFSEELVTKQSVSPASHYLIYTDFPPQILQARLQPIIDYLSVVADIDLVIKKEKCQIYLGDGFEDAALIFTNSPMIDTLFQREYTPLIFTHVEFNILLVSGQEISALADIAGKRVTFMPRFTNLFKAIIERENKKIWPSIIPVTSLERGADLIRVINGSAEYALITEFSWQIASESIKERLYVKEIPSGYPWGVIMAHPKLTESLKQNYQLTFTTMHQKSEDVRASLNGVGIESFKVVTPEVNNRVLRMGEDAKIEKCWQE